MITKNFKQVLLTEEEMIRLKLFTDVIECPDKSIKCDICPFCLDNFCVVRLLRNITENPKIRERKYKNEQIKEKISTDQL